MLYSMAFSTNSFDHFFKKILLHITFFEFSSITDVVYIITYCISSKYCMQLYAEQSRLPYVT